jgi:DNA polymerase I-like protein with 3'-5' exonuclease and polymerase domains
MALYGGIELPNVPDPENIRKLDLIQLPMIRAMMRFGMRIDKPHFAELSSRLNVRMADLRCDILNEIPAHALDRFVAALDDGDEDSESEIADIVPPEFNVESSRKVAELLYDVLGLQHTKGVKVKKTKGGKRLSTGKKTLEQLKREHPVVPLILEYRECSKLGGTYAQSMPRKARFHPKGLDCPLCGRRHYSDEWRVHTQITTTRTATGRTASKNPNLANIPTRTKLGQEIRAGFIASDGCVIAQRDFAQIELRLGADRSGDANMLRIYKRDGDIHVDTAMRAFDKSEAEVSTGPGKMLYRAPSKNVNFAVCISKGQPVLTNRGCIPIEKVTPGMLLWDGVGWVSHSGVIPKGIRKVIEYEGLKATADHKVWVQDGRVLCLAQAVAERCQLATGGIEETPVRYTADQELALGQQSHGGYSSLHRLWQGGHDSSVQSEEGVDSALYLSEAPEISGSCKASSLAIAPLYSHQTTLLESTLRILGKLRRPWHREQVQDIGRVCSLRANQSAAQELQGGGHRKNRQRWTLRARQSALGEERIQSTEHPKKCLGGLQGESTNSSGFALALNKGLPGFSSEPDTYQEFGGGRRIVAINPYQDSTQEMETEVYDILNAGPRRRFTVSGKLVSNCYGITGAGLLDLMGVTFATANLSLPDFMDEPWCARFIDKWFTLYPGMRRYLDDEESKARRFGIVWTAAGRVRRIPETQSCHSYIQEAGVRQGCNHSIQGYSADLMKLSMGESWERLEQMRHDYGILAWPEQTIYDELLIETAEDNGEAVEAMLEEVMDGVLIDKVTGVSYCQVPIRSDGKLLTRWTK